MITSTGHQRLFGNRPLHRAATLALLFALFLTISTGAAFGGPVPDTGQTACYDVEGNIIPCPSSDKDLYGQDGNYTINSPSFTKLGQDGVELSVAATHAEGWIMTRDNVTGLIWEIKTDDGSIHDKDNTYTWYDSNPETNGGNPGTPGDNTDTEDFIQALNTEKFGGYLDWRMPTRKELRSIVDYGKYNPSVNTDYFPNAMASYYWSSTTDAAGNDNAWAIYFYTGDNSSPDKGDDCHVRAVRGGQ